MASYFNQHSFSLTAAAAILLMLVIVARARDRGSALVALAALGLGLALAYLLLRPGRTTLPAGRSLDDLLGQGKPVLLEFQSPY
jgi:hypothetical protein